MKKIVIILFILMMPVLASGLFAQNTSPAKITIGKVANGTNPLKFYNNFGKDEIYLVAANHPWHGFNSFGIGGFDYSWWEKSFENLSSEGIRALRIWITCDGGGPVRLITNEESEKYGHVDNIDSRFWDDLDKLFELAGKYRIYLMPTLISFDHFNSKNASLVAQRNAYRAMIRNTKAIDNFISNYIVKFVNRYGNNPWLFAIDLCNEIVWLYESQLGKEYTIPWDNICEYIARATIAIKETNSDVLVTLGLGFIKYQGRGNEQEGNRTSDAYLKSLVKNEGLYKNANLARLDFFSDHHYSWMTPYYGSPMRITPWEYRNLTKDQFDRPVIIGEFPAVSEKSTLAEDYITTYKNGWGGLFPWTSTGMPDLGRQIDGAGNWFHVRDGARGFYKEFPHLFPKR